MGKSRHSSIFKVADMTFIFSLINPLANEVQWCCHSFYYIIKNQFLVCKIHKDNVIIIIIIVIVFIIINTSF